MPSLEVAETVRGKAMVINPAVDDVAMETSPLKGWGGV